MTSLFIFHHKSIGLTFAIVCLLNIKQCYSNWVWRHVINLQNVIIIRIQLVKMTYFRRFSSYGFSIYFPDRLLSIKCIFCNITTYVNFIVLYEQVKKDNTRPYGKCIHELTVFYYVCSQYIDEIHSKCIYITVMLDRYLYWYMFIKILAFIKPITSWCELFFYNK